MRPIALLVWCLAVGSSSLGPLHYYHTINCINRIITMAPMARTSRSGVPANNVDALDNLDLDDMFSGGGDALFDGLDDLDMGNIEEITTDNNKARTPAPAPAAPKPAAEEEDGVPKRRKTKRKTTAPTFFDDLDDDSADHEPVKKKKRTSKGTATKRGRGKKGAAAATAAASTKKSKTTPKAGAPATARATTESGAVSTPPMVGAAAVGQFGTRQKKTVGTKAKTTKSKAAKQRVDPKARHMLPTAANRAAAAAAVSPPAPIQPVAPAPASTPLPPPKPTASHSLYCGLPPSNSVFYPFMPALPTEVALKNRKVFTLMDRVHTSFLGYFGHGTSAPTPLPQGIETVKEDEAIFKLTQEAFKGEKNATSHVTAADRSKAIGAAIGAMRKAISLFDKGKLANDLIAVCALLRRQHDFVKQNNANMEQWCKEHFSEEDFAAVYQEGKKKRKAAGGPAAPGSSGPVAPVLSTFKVPQVKVKIVCTGFKEPKTALVAALPADPKKAQTTRTGKKKSDAESSSSAAIASSSAAAAAAAAAADLNYARQTPLRRRKTVSALISRVAQTLEIRQHQKVEKRRQAILSQEKRRKDVAEDTSVAVIHTAGMWKYLQESGYFEDAVTDADLQERFDSIQPMKGETGKNGATSSPLGDSASGRSEKIANDGSPTERLIGLLVEEREGSGSELSDEDDGSSIGSGSSVDDTRDLLDLSDLTEDERVLIQLRMMGLASQDNLFLEIAKPVATNAGPVMEIPSQTSALPVPKPPDELAQKSPVLLPGPKQEKQDDIDDIVAGMIHDLHRTTSMISARSEFAQKMTRDRVETPEESTRRRHREASILVRGATLLKRNKEAKAKAVKTKSKEADDLNLPW